MNAVLSLSPLRYYFYANPDPKLWNHHSWRILFILFSFVWKIHQTCHKMTIFQDSYLLTINKYNKKERWLLVSRFFKRTSGEKRITVIFSSDTCIRLNLLINLQLKTSAHTFEHRCTKIFDKSQHESCQLKQIRELRNLFKIVTKGSKDVGCFPVSCV